MTSFVSPAHLDVRNLDKRFTLHLLGGRTVHALRGVSFSAPQGAFLALIGASGSGKSTLLKCLYRSCLTTAGEIDYRTATGDIVDLATASDDEMIELRGAAREIGYVSQFLRPTPRVTALDLVAAPLVAAGTPREDARTRAAALLGRLGIPVDLFDGFPALFSGGEQQRVNIARALIRLPRLLLLDEPTSALDSANLETVVDVLAEVQARGTTVIGIFHDLDVVERLAGSYLLMRAGQVIDRGEGRAAALAARSADRRAAETSTF